MGPDNFGGFDWTSLATWFTPGRDCAWGIQRAAQICWEEWSIGPCFSLSSLQLCSGWAASALGLGLIIGREWGRRSAVTPQHIHVVVNASSGNSGSIPLQVTLPILDVGVGRVTASPASTVRIEEIPANAKVDHVESPTVRQVLSAPDSPPVAAGTSTSEPPPRRTRVKKDD